MENKEMIQDLVEELDGVQCQISLSRDFFELIAQETEQNKTPERAAYIFKRLQTLHAVYLDRIRKDEEDLNNVFDKLHKATA